MSAECYRIKVPEGRRLTGVTASGQRVQIPAGDHHVHRLLPKTPTRTGAIAALRFVAADGGHDVHIAVPADADIRTMLDVDVQAVDGL